MKNLTPEQLEKRKKTNKKVLAFGCLPMLLIFILIVIFAPKTDNEPPKPKTMAEIIKAQFNPYSGENFYVESFIKKNMNDPKSYEHVETKYTLNKDSTIYLVTKFRGNNAFGAKVIQTARLRMDLKGNVFQVLE